MKRTLSALFGLAICFSVAAQHDMKNMDKPKKEAQKAAQKTDNKPAQKQKANPTKTISDKPSKTVVYHLYVRDTNV
jgi:hypothetical protein